ncbi:MAG: hypothetical protein J6C86_04580 [Bacteroidaceae bacterium]|nr:hypothetical protein [Bacteroidaceae bacterium]
MENKAIDMPDILNVRRIRGEGNRRPMQSINENKNFGRHISSMTVMNSPTYGWLSGFISFEDMIAVIAVSRIADGAKLNTRKQQRLVHFLTYIQ